MPSWMKPIKSFGLLMLDVAFILQTHGWVRIAAVYTAGVLTGIWASELLLRYILKEVSNGSLE